MFYNLLQCFYNILTNVINNFILTLCQETMTITGERLCVFAALSPLMSLMVSTTVIIIIERKEFNTDCGHPRMVNLTVTDGIIFLETLLLLVLFRKQHPCHIALAIILGLAFLSVSAWGLTLNAESGASGHQPSELHYCNAEHFNVNIYSMIWVYSGILLAVCGMLALVVLCTLVVCCGKALDS